jgi:hypothetical protein
VGAAAGQLLTPKHIQCRLTHAQPAFPYIHAWPRAQAESGAGWVPGQLLGQYQMPRSHTQRCVVEPERHCDWPAVLHAVPTPGSVDTTSQRLFAALPPVDEVPPEVVVVPPVDVLLPPVVLLPPTWLPPVEVAPPVALLPPDDVLPPTVPPPVPLVDVPPTVPPSVEVVPPADVFPPVSVVAAGFLDVPQPTLKAVSAPSSVTLNRPSVLMS